MKKTLLYLAVSLSAVILYGNSWEHFFADPLPSKCKWIWYRENPRKDEIRYFRKEFTLDKAVSGGFINVSGDDIFDFYINGHKVLTGAGFKNAPIPAEKYLQQGKNVFAARVHNIVSGAGFLLRAEIHDVAGNVSVISTDNSWKCAKNTSGMDFFSIDFSDVDWETPVEVRDVTAMHSWRKVINLRNFLSAEEFSAYRQYTDVSTDAVTAMHKDMLDKLAAEPEAQPVKIIRKNGVPWYVSGDWEHPVFLYNAAYLKPFPGEHGHMPRLRRFHDAGFRVFCMMISLKEFWKPTGFDYAAAEKMVLNMLCAVPEARLNIAIDVTPPEWFLKRYPDENIAYASGSTPVYGGDELRIAALRPSMASNFHKRQAGAIIGRLVRNLEASPMAKRIISYQLNNGLYAEWHYFGMPKEMPDTGKAMTVAFRDYLRRKYKNDTALQKAWKNNSVSLQTAEVPGKTERLFRPSGVLLNPALNRQVEDYLACHAATVNECQMYFNKMVKIASKNRVLTGNYSGYFFGMAYPAVGYQTATPAVMRSEFMDFQAAPYSYAFRNSGASGLPRNVFESYPLNGKFTILESDARTHASGDHRDGRSFSENDTFGQLTRDFCNAVTRGGGLWYYDFSVGWYDHEQYLSLFGRLSEILQNGADVSRCSAVAYVCDFDSINYHTNAVNPNDFTFRAINNTLNELFYTGAAFDTILLEDLEKCASKYKVLIFGNLIHYTPQKALLIKKLRQSGKTLIFLYAPGVACDRGVDPGNIASLTGIKTRLSTRNIKMQYNIYNKKHPFTVGRAGQNYSLNLEANPFFVITDPNAEILGYTPYYKEHYPSLAVKQVDGSTVILSTVPFIHRELFRNIFRNSGVHIYTDNTGDVSYISKGLIGMHSAAGGQKKIRLASPAGKITRLLPEQTDFPAGDEINFEMSPSETVLFKVEY